MKPFITVVMPVRNEARFIHDTLEQLVAQDYPTDCYEIIVADGESDDGTQALVEEMSRQYPQIWLANNPSRLSSAGRNIGFKNGKGDYFLVVDGHCFIPTTELFNNVVACFEKSGADCLGRPQPLDPPGLSIFQKAVALARGSRLGHGGDSLIYSDYEGFASPVSNGAVYRKDVFDTVGYVDETFDAAEDVEFNYRIEKAGCKAYISPRLTIRYYPRENVKGLFRQMARYGMGRRRFILKHPEALSLSQMVPAMFVVGILVWGVTCAVIFLNPLPFLCVSLMYSFYLLVTLIESVRLAHRTPDCVLLLPWIFFVIHYGLGWGFLKEVVVRSRTAVVTSVQNNSETPIVNS